MFPGRPGRTVWLQRHSAGGWRYIDSQALNRQSGYSFAVTPRTTAGPFGYRAVYGAAVSRTVTLTHYRWHYLSTLPFVGDPKPPSVRDCSSVETINGSFFAHACTIGAEWNAVDTYAAAWDLKRGCTTFQGTGLLDSDNSKARTNLAISADGLDLYEHTYAYGQSAKVSVPITGHARLRFTTLGRVEHVESMTIGLGGPRIRCAW